MKATDQPFLPLDDEQAADASRTGGKAAALARARSAGLTVPDGFVVPIDATAGSPEKIADRLSPHVEELLAKLPEGSRVVVRSSSPAEDRSGTSMAGRFESVSVPATREGLQDAIREVVRSRDEVAQQTDTDPALALLIQQAVDADMCGVMFTIDPVTSDPSRIVISASTEGPEALVSGAVVGSTHVIDHAGDVLEQEHGDGGAELDDEQLRAFAELARRVQEVSGAPQDVEWAIDGGGRLWLLQSRPITVVRDFPLDPTGRADEALPILGPGPVAETFPIALHALEADLWVPPLREALRRVFQLVANATGDEVDASRS